MKPIISDPSWLPAREEWDFRDVEPGECRVACHWEYMRRHYRVLSEAAVPAGEGLGGNTSVMDGPAHFHGAAREFFPRAWVTLSQADRHRVMDSFPPIPALQVRTLRDFLPRLHGAMYANSKLGQGFFSHAYVILPNFTGAGVEAVIREFKKWARSEARHHRRSARAKAAMLPFDALKWLAVWRLDEARRGVGVTFARTREALLSYRKKNPQACLQDVFPIYSSHGAWCKARSDAEHYYAKLLSSPSLLL